MMTGLQYGRTDMISSLFPTLNLSVATVLLFAVWVMFHLLGTKSRNKIVRTANILLKYSIATLTIWLMLQIFGRYILLGTGWNLWCNAAISAAVIEAMIILYQHEYILTTKVKAYTMVSLRSAAIVIITFILAKPIMREQTQKGIARTVAVLIDDSSSMYFTDNQLSVSEKLDIAQLYELEGLDRRPQMSMVLGNMQDSRTEMTKLALKLELPLNLDSNYLETKFLELRDEVSDIMTNSSKRLRTAIAVFETIQKDLDHYGGPARATATLSAKRIKERILKPTLKSTTLAKSSKDLARRYTDLQNTVEQIRFETGEFLDSLAVVQDELDNAYYMQLKFELREKINKAAQVTRAELARKIVLSQTGTTEDLLSTISATHQLRVILFSDKQHNTSKSELSTEQVPQTESQRTDLTAALEMVKKEIPQENLAGVIVISDGCHNARTRIEPIAKQFSRQRVPVCAIRVGGTKVPRDNALSNVVYPTSIFLGEKLSIGVEVISNGYKDREVVVELLQGKKVIADKKIYINSDRFKSIANLTTTPEEKGVFPYHIRIVQLDGEASTKNNDWNITVAVSDDRTNVLLADNHPRWEFRYLRNLFHGRDKSVHLQHLLISPDTVAGAAEEAAVFASTEREFGDDRATAFPKSKKEWAKFDVIILGDISPEMIDKEMLESINYAVKERGALLVCIAGNNYMPHSFNSPTLTELLPAVTAKPKAYIAPFTIELTPFGRHHMITQQSESVSENLQIWDSFPAMHWRVPVTSIKPKAKIIAYADQTTPSLDSALSQTLRQSQEQQLQNALIVAHRAGLGRVVMLNFDRTWRMRYGFGDTYHHRFWKQLINWGIGDKLRSGNDYIRLGTPALTYTNNDKVTVLVKIQNSQFKPVNNGQFHINIFSGDKKLRRKKLRYKENSAGMYSASFEPFSDAGKYSARLDNDQLTALNLVEKNTILQTEFVVVSPKVPIEISELAARDDLLNQLTTITDGKKGTILAAHSFIPKFGKGNKFITITKDTPLWDSFTLMLVLLALISLEWIIRKFGGLV